MLKSAVLFPVSVSLLSSSSAMALVNASLDDIVAMRKAADSIRAPRNGANNANGGGGGNGNGAPSSARGHKGGGGGRRGATGGSANASGSNAGNVGSGGRFCPSAIRVEKIPKVVVSNVSPGASKEELERLFETFGRVVALGPVNREIATTEVTYGKLSEAEEAKDFCDGIVLGGLPIRVEVGRKIIRKADEERESSSGSTAATGGGALGGGDSSKKKKSIVPIVYDVGPSGAANESGRGRFSSSSSGPPPRLGGGGGSKGSYRDYRKTKEELDRDLDEYMAERNNKSNNGNGANGGGNSNSGGNGGNGRKRGQSGKGGGRGGGGGGGR